MSRKVETETESRLVVVYDWVAQEDSRVTVIM